MKNKMIFIQFIILSLSLNMFAQNNGLIGLLYDDTELSRMSGIWYLEGLNSETASWQDKSDFSARWLGTLKAPVNGEITLYAEADNEVELKVNGNIFINTWEGAELDRNQIIVQQGEDLKLSIKYRQISGPSYMRFYWSWDGHERELIPEAALWISEEQEEEIQKEFRSVVDIDFEALKFDVASAIHIHSSEDVSNKRKQLKEFLWGVGGYPKDKLPVQIWEGIDDADYDTLSNLQRIDKLQVSMDYGLNSYVYHFVPENSNGSVAIYHQGHGGKFLIGINTISTFLNEGYDVFAISMPLLGLNNKPIVDTKNYGRILLQNHGYFAFLNPDSGHPVKYFLEPVVVTLNYIDQQHFDQTIMAGLSGGGWTTTLSAAIDPRIKISFPVAGSLPVYLRSKDMLHSGTLGDYEQQVPELYTLANYMDLYIMGAAGKGRGQLQILNEFDACCFSGTGFNTYESIVSERVRLLGDGAYEVFLDSTHRLHQISPRALEVITQYLKEH